LDDAIARAKGRELTSQLVERLQGQREEGAALMRQLARDAQEDYFRRRMQEAMFEKRRTAGRRQLESFVGEVGGPPLDLISSVTALPTISGKVPGTDFKVATAPGSFDLSAGGPGLFKMSLRTSEDWLRSKLNVDLVIGLETPLGAIEGGMRRTTQW